MLEIFKKLNLGGSKLNTITSPVPSLLLSNRTPTDAETILIQNSLKAADEERYKVRTLWGPVNALSRDKQNEREYLDYLIAFYHQHVSLLSCIRCIPLEVLALIFSFTATPEKYPGDHEPPWVLSHVSQRWRQVALSNPVLWRYLPPILIIYRPKRSYEKRVIAKLTTLLNRSSGEKIPLCIKVLHTRSRGSPILDLLFSHSDRWEELSVLMTGLTIPHFDIIRGRLSSLRSLTFQIIRTRTWHQVDMFEVASKLREKSV